jgi:hypothetical protein
MGGQPLIHFNEGFASLGYLYVAHNFSERSDHYNVGDTGYNDLMQDYTEQIQRFS